ncbi:hypothetical protein AGMMS50262_16260 [Bacteroidia bacterium]|nr:hypothetical protein AGMMS50262_16260 [Bacteroidia bacterium]
MKKMLLIVCALLLGASFSFAQTELTFDQYGNVELSQLEGYSDNAIVTINITITNAGGVGAGWGIGKITDIAYAKDNTDFQEALEALEVSEEGVINAYTFTVAQIKAIASIPAADLETLKEASAKVYGTDWTVNDEGYIVDQYDRIGFVVNVWGAATRTSITVEEKDASAGVNILADFSTLVRGDNSTSQQGWGGETGSVNSIINEFAEAEYFVIETKGIGEGAGANADGFGGIQLIVQGGSAEGAEEPVSLSWTQVSLNGDWITYQRAEGKTVSIAVNLANALGDNYAKFIKCDGWAQLYIASYGGTSAFENLGFVNAYLVSGLEKPADAVDLNSNYGFIFDGSIITGIKGLVPVISNAYGVYGGIAVDAVNQKVSVYGFDGRLVKQTIADGSIISVSKGLYIVKVGAEKAVKVLVK